MQQSYTTDIPEETISIRKSLSAVAKGGIIETMKQPLTYAARLSFMKFA